MRRNEQDGARYKPLRDAFAHEDFFLLFRLCISRMGNEVCRSGLKSVHLSLTPRRNSKQAGEMAKQRICITTPSWFTMTGRKSSRKDESVSHQGAGEYHRGLVSHAYFAKRYHDPGTGEIATLCSRRSMQVALWEVLLVIRVRISRSHAVAQVSRDRTAATGRDTWPEPRIIWGTSRSRG